MTQFTLPLIFGACFLGLILLDTIGAIASRKLNYKYAWMSICKLVIYVASGYFTSKQFGVVSAMLSNAALGLFEGSAGIWLIIFLKANTRENEEQSMKYLKPLYAAVMTGVALFFCIIGVILNSLGS